MRLATLYFILAILVVTRYTPRAWNDPETFVWWIVPLVAAIAGAVYEARRHHLRDQEHDARLSALERIEAARSAVAEYISSASDTSNSDTIDLTQFVGQVAINTQAIGAMEERLAGLEKKKR